MSALELDLALYEATALLARVLGGRGGLADILESIYAGEPGEAWDILRAYLRDVPTDDPVYAQLRDRLEVAGAIMGLEFE
jgi:hypothetical protein